MKQYVPLHLHTEYSLLDGATRISELIKHAKENNMPAAAITDHGVMYGAVEFYRLAKEEGIKPIIGCELYIIDGDITDKSSKQTNYHLVLLARDKKGYQNLVKLVSIAHMEGFYYKPRINKELLKEYKDGLICLSACLSGEVTKKLLNKNKEGAKEAAKFYKELFGEDFYIELQDHGIEGQKMTNPDLIKIAQELDIGLIITNDSHYTKKEDALSHDILLCLQTGKTIQDPARMKFPNEEFYIKNADELRETFNWLDEDIFEQAIDNTVKIAEKCNLILEMGKSILPYYPIPANHSVESYLDKVVRDGLSKRYKEITPEFEQRIKYELKIIAEMGFSTYFLIVWDFIKFARENGIPVGPGRGSAAGSLVAYALEITEIDPIEHNLLFERFLNPERISMPDVDIDFCIEKRDKVINYVSDLYGQDKVCQIITFGTLAARAALKSVARVMDIPYADADRLAKMIPSLPKTKIDDALQEGMDLKKVYDKDPKVKELVDQAKSIEGIKFNIGTHAAGVIISRDPLTEIVPIQYSKEKAVITTYPMGDLEKLGLLKMDFLGLRNLTIIHNTVNIIKERHGIGLDIDKIRLDDPPVYEMLSKGDTDGVFQLESSGMKTLVKDLRPSVFEDLGALVALFRPGPLNSGMVGDFVQRKHGRQKVEYKHPALEPILKDTYGTIVYQEQIMQIAQSLAGYTLGEADILRRAMGKKKLDEMNKQKELFLSGAQKNNVDTALAEELFETMLDFAAYCFNRAHSAAYAFLAYQTAYLKAHYPVEYMSSLLSSVSSNQDKIQQYIAECQKMGIEILPPDVNKSRADFTPDGNNIRFGLCSLKNVGSGVVEEIIKGRQSEDYKSFYDFCIKIDLKSFNKRTFESLIKAGAFSEIEKSRKQLVENLDSAINTASRESEAKASGQINLFAAMAPAAAPTFQMKGSDEDFSDSEIQSFEKEYLGFYVTSHPLSSIRDQLPFLTTHNIAELKEIKEGAIVTVCGLITGVRQVFTKSNKMLKVGTVEDLTGNVDFVAYSEILDKYGSFLEPESKVIIGGKIQLRGDDESQVSIIINEVSKVENCNIVNIYLNQETRFEEMMALKDILTSHKGNDPVVFNVKNNGSMLKILAASNYWVRADSEIENLVKNHFKSDIQICSLDCA